MGWGDVDWLQLPQDTTVADCCERNNGASGSIKGGIG